MGRNFAVDWLPHYREVLVTNAVRAVRDSLPAADAFTTAERRAWLAQPAVHADWRAVAIAAAISLQAATR